MRCPVCRAENVGEPQCRRCRADLGLLFALEEQRRSLLDQAARAAQRGDGKAVSRLATEAHELRHGVDSRRMLAIGRLLQGQFREAWDLYRLLDSLSGEPQVAVLER